MLILSEIDTYSFIYQVIEFIGLLLGKEVTQDLPHPGEDMDGFMDKLQTHLDATEPQYDILTWKVSPLIDLYRLKKHLKWMMGGSWCTIM